MTENRWIVEESTVSRIGPHRRGRDSHQDFVRSWTLAAGLIGVWGVVLYGPSALIILLVCVISCAATEFSLGFMIPRSTSQRLSIACLYGLLFGLTLPATAPWYVAMLGSLIVMIIGQGVFGGVLHPALVGRVIVQFLFSGRLSLTGALALSPILAPGHLLTGDLFNTHRVLHYQGWQQTHTLASRDSFLLERPVQTLQRFAQDGTRPDGELYYTPLLRDLLPPWMDTLWGVVPGGIGESPTLIILIAGFYLIYRGYLRWQLPVIVLATAALAVAILPVAQGGHYRWFPILEVEQHHAVGIAYVFYHLTSGQLMLGAFILAGNVVATPMRVHGQMIFAAGVGAVTIFMRLYGILDGECYWSILIMNTLVGTIDRHMKRPIWGFAE